MLTGALGNVQVADLKLEGGNGQERAVQEIALAIQIETWSIGANVRHLNSALARDLRENTGTVPDFLDAMRRHRLIAAIETAGLTGVAQAL